MSRHLAFAASLLASLLCAPAIAATADRSAVTVPLIKGLTLTGAASERQGDYETTHTVESIDESAVHLVNSGEIPDPAGGKSTPVSIRRDVRSIDLKEGRTYKYLFTNGETEFAGTTALGTSAAVINDLRAHGKTSITLDGKPGGLAGLLTGMMAMMPNTDAPEGTSGYLSGSGILQSVESKPVAFPVIVNNTLVSLPVWHLKGLVTQDDEAVNVEWFVLDDPANALTLRFAFGTEKLEIVRISYPTPNEAADLERQLTDKRRAVVYGIYFDFNSAAIKPTSAPMLRTIADVLKKDPTWILNVEGHTDNVGGDVRNQDLSARRAAAVKAALVALGIAPARLNTAGYGASVPRETNTTLAGRARNRRVELTRQ